MPPSKALPLFPSPPEKEWPHLIVYTDGASRNNPGDAARRAFFASQAGIGEKALALAEELAANADAPSPITSHTKTLLKKTLLAICES